MEQRIQALYAAGNITRYEAMALLAACDNFTITLAVGDRDADELRRMYGSIVCDHFCTAEHE